jgi:hypothetical protein
MRRNFALRELRSRNVLFSGIVFGVALNRSMGAFGVEIGSAAHLCGCIHSTQPPVFKKMNGFGHGIAPI